MHSFVFISLLNQVLTFVIFTSKIDCAFIHQKIYTILLTLSDCIEDRCLTVVVHMIWITTLLNKHLHYVFMAFSRRVKDRRLAITIHMVRFASIFQEKFTELAPSIPWNIEQTCLVKCVLERRIAFGFFDQVFRHIICLLIIFNKATYE